MCTEEETLRGGLVNAVVRVGDTVRRIAGPSTPTIHRLLRHVRARGVTWVPAPLGYDELGREVLTFIPGSVPHDMPDWIWSEAVLMSAGRALREWHEATVGFDVTSAIWNLSPREPCEVICHNDFAPYNCVFRDEQLSGVIDFDACVPGPRLWDLAYAAYRFVPLTPSADTDIAPSNDERSPFVWAESLVRLKTFLESYSAFGPPLHYEPLELIETAIERLRSIAAWTKDQAGMRESTTLAAHAQMYLTHASWLLTQVGRMNAMPANTKI